MSTPLTKERLRNLRMTCGLTREAMASLLDYNCKYYAALERGDYPLPPGLIPRLRQVLKDHADHMAKRAETLGHDALCQGGLT